jgi:hypothetical protein
MQQEFRLPQTSARQESQSEWSNISHFIMVWDNDRNGQMRHRHVRRRITSAEVATLTGVEPAFNISQTETKDFST